MNCGDVSYRSSLDPKLRLEEQGATPLGLALLAIIFIYTLIQPGVLAGALDYYIVAPIDRNTRPKFRKRDFELRKKLGTGAFGVVYQAVCDNKKYVASAYPGESDAPVVVKKAKDYGLEEAWMNERVRRACKDSCAEFLDAFQDGRGDSEVTWLVWKYEGGSTLNSFLSKREFPGNLEVPLFGRPLAIEDKLQKSQVVIKEAMTQILENLKALHSGGLVHRDMKPENLIFADSQRRLKIIDLGAAADLRIGINYIPKEFLLDPRYCAPERFIMSTRTPDAPPLVIAALLSPVLWQLNRPDKFDMYAVGMMLMQMAFPNLRTDSQIIAFRRSLEGMDYNVKTWRAKLEASKRLSKENQAGFELLDLNNGAGWELVTLLMDKRPSARISADQALKHRWLGEGSQNPLAKSVDAGFQDQSWILNKMSGNGVDDRGFTEAQLDDMGYKGTEDEDEKNFVIPELPSFFMKRMQRTIARVQTRASSNKKKGFW